MLEKPDIADEKIIACLQTDYGLTTQQIAFLALGADRDTAVYRVVADDETPYFLKLRRGIFDETSVTLPKFFAEQGIAQIIVPIPTQTGQLYTHLDDFNVILYPFIQGKNGYEVALSDRQWIQFGAALKRIHTAAVPPEIAQHIHLETFSPLSREHVREFLKRLDEKFDDPIAKELAAFLKTKRDGVLDLVERAEKRAQALVHHSPNFIVCHSDIHAGNLLIARNLLIESSGTFYIVDWDAPILAPKERDLMSIGAGLFGNTRTPQQEESLFYRGYGGTQIDPIALAYYRYERIVQDLAVECEQIFLKQAGDEDRAQELYYLKSNFLPNGTIEIAYAADSSNA